MPTQGAPASHARRNRSPSSNGLFSKNPPRTTRYTAVQTGYPGPDSFRSHPMRHELVIENVNDHGSQACNIPGLRGSTMIMDPILSNRYNRFPFHPKWDSHPFDINIPSTHPAGHRHCAHKSITGIHAIPRKCFDQLALQHQHPPSTAPPPIRRLCARLSGKRCHTDGTARSQFHAPQDEISTAQRWGNGQPTIQPGTDRSDNNLMQESRAPRSSRTPNESCKAHPPPMAGDAATRPSTARCHPRAVEHPKRLRRHRRRHTIARRHRGVRKSKIENISQTFVRTTGR